MKRTLIGSLAFLCTLAAAASNDARWQIQTSIYTTHFSPQSHHNNDQAMLGLEYDIDTDRNLSLGAATFRNSYHQRSTYVYGSWRLDHQRWPVYAKLSGGLLHGYRGEYQDHIPLNNLGIAPVLLPALGVSTGPLNSEVVVFGAAGLMVNVGYRF